MPDTCNRCRGSGVVTILEDEACSTQRLKSVPCSLCNSIEWRAYRKWGIWLDKDKEKLVKGAKKNGDKNR